jgi:FdhD protein
VRTLEEVDVLRIDVSNRKAQCMKDFVAQEKPLYIFVNRTLYATIFCSPLNLKELAVGHLVSEGIVKSIEEVEDIDLKEDVCRVKLRSSVDLKKRMRLSKYFQRVILSACGSNGAFRPSQRMSRIESNLTVSAEVIQSCVNMLNKTAEIFRKTGGVHAAAIFKNDGTLIAFAEDVGRHNAVDKALGVAIMHKVDLENCFLASTGRLTGDIVMKTARVKLPIVASIAAALDSGIAIARKVNLTLIGFVRGGRMNVYTFDRRILS